MKAEMWWHVEKMAINFANANNKRRKMQIVRYEEK